MARRFRQHLTALNDENLGAYQDLSLQYAWNFAYEAKEDPSKLTGEFMDQDFKLEEATSKKNIILVAMINYHRLHLSITFERDPLELYEIADSVVGFGVTFIHGNGLTPKCTFVIGIIHIQAYVKTKKSRHLKAAKAMKKRMRGWIASGNPNVPHFMSILSAEICSATNKIDKAREHFNTAISSAARSGFRIDFAFANHLHALFCEQKLNDHNLACHFMDEAVTGYESIGAFEVARHLLGKYPHLTAKKQREEAR